MARIHGCFVTSREEMLFVKYEHYGKCKGSFRDLQRKCKYREMSHVTRNPVFGVFDKVRHKLGCTAKVREDGQWVMHVAKANALYAFIVFS